MALTVSAATFMLCIALMSQPLRGQLPPLAIAFAALDRPEDRPLTIAWLLTAVAATWAVLMVWAVEPLDMLHAWYRQALGEPVVYIYMGPGIGLSHIMLALFISGVGDALAEPVGLAFGRHKYRVRALWTDRVYTRSLEGSACVLLSGIVGVLFVQWVGPGFGTDSRFVLTLILVPIAATLAEAFSPHTWDQPLIIASCGLSAALIDWIAYW